MSCQRKLMFRLMSMMLCVMMLACTVSAAETRSDEVYCFSPLDFTAGDSPLSGVCITAAPEESLGTIKIGNRVIRSGDVLTVRQLEEMVFCPMPSQSDASAMVSYLPIFADRIAPEATMVISIRGKEDKAPIAEDSAMETYKNLANQGTLKVSDPEGQALTFTLVRQPKRGVVTFSEDGTFLYTPKNNKVGTDSFTYTAADPAGNVSREATVTIKILKPADSTLYTDTAGLDCRFAAEWMRNTGIFSGETVNGQSCFNPEKEVSRGQFLAMLMQVLDLPVERSATETGFLDDAPVWLKPYLSAALRSGIVAGYPAEGGVEFRPDQPVCAGEAAAMIHNALNFAVPTGSPAEETEIADQLSLPDGTMTRGSTAVVLYQVSRIAAEQTAFTSIFHP